MEKEQSIPLNPSISQLVGASPVALPNESQDDFERDVALLQAEFNAYQPLQRYLVEKLCERMWWLRRYESFKREQVRRYGVVQPNEPVMLRPQQKKALQEIDERIAMEFKLLGMLQGMLEAEQTRTLRRKKMKLQVQAMERAIHAIEIADLA